MTITQRFAGILAVTALSFGLTACNKAEDKTAGQQLDSAIAKTEQAAANADAKMDNAMAAASQSMANSADKMADAASNAAAATGAAMDNAGMTAHVKAELIKEPILSALTINVDSDNGVVTLKGTVMTEEAKGRAGDIAKGVSGVTSVDNQLMVKTN
jgi:hyperosmotically inducible protein